ncbi:unnamed protein product [Phytomonas sp. EM1]|nr:unnamed protein product [Phytomonas sp. EM1]|eukprot:CCW63843.1 unnamed protein product [Phytomonas sp. isolate EM1]
MQKQNSTISSPPPFTELHTLVGKYLTKGSDVEGWQLDAMEKVPGRFQVYPFVEHQLVGANLIYKNQELGLEAKFRWANAWKSWKQYMPHVSYFFIDKGLSHKVEFNAPVDTLSYTLNHPSISASWSSELSNKGVSTFNLSTRLCKPVCAGVSFLYDPIRSGIKDAVALVTYANCQTLAGGDLVAKYALSNGLSLHLRAPVDPCSSIVVLAERNRFLAGLHTSLNNSARLIVNANLTDGSCTLTAIRNLRDIWKVSFTCSLPVLNTGTFRPKYGIKLSNKDVEE